MSAENTAPATELGETEAAVRSEQGWIGKAVFAVGIVISLVHVYFNVFGVLPTLWQNAIHFAGFAFLAALIYPLRQGGGRATLLLDLGLGLLAAFSALYMVAMEDAIYERGVHLAPAEWVAGTVLILCAIEFTRRTTGWIIPVLIVAALTYVGWWGELIPGVFRFSGLTHETILFRSVFGDDGLFGNIARISSTFVFMFILFGAFLLKSGAGEFVIDLARVVAGRTVGGAGLVAVIASGLTGTISGSAVANTASTGVITIPLMKRAGFPGRFAGGVEAAASTGGQLMPPIMGAGAFVMASYTQISYTTIVALSVLPAVLYFLTVAYFVRIEAKRLDLRPAEEAGESAFAVLKRGGLPFLLPITVLIGLLIYGFTPTYAAGISIVAVVVSSWLTPKRMGIREILGALALGARNMVMTGILLCSVGLVVNVIATAGIGNTFSLMITEWAGDSLIIAIVLVGLASLVLGMGLPVTASYIVLGTLSAPALYDLIAQAHLLDLLVSTGLPEQARTLLMLVDPALAEQASGPMAPDAARALMQAVPHDLFGALRDAALSPEVLGMLLLAAHLVIFWLSQDSNVTPPVCLTAFTAAAIAKTSPMKTGLQSWKIAKGLYVVPLLFAYTPLIWGDFFQQIEVFAFAVVGLYALSGVLQGHLEAPIGPVGRGLCLVAGIAMLWPEARLVNFAGLVSFAVVFTASIGVRFSRPAAL